MFVTRWPFRSHELFSWDSANFALALQQIDIAAHQPHPPGYLGYVFAGRALQLLALDANTALVVWNMIATVLAVVVLATFAYEVAGRDRPTLTAAAAASVILTSPLVWFYGEVAEIYPSELLFATLVAYAASRAARGLDRGIYECVLALTLAAVFKIVTAMLMFPVVVVAWTRVSSAARRRSFAMAVFAAVVVTLGFLLVQRDLLAVASRLLGSSDWTIWFLRTDTDNLLRILNRNLRNTLTAAIVGIGVVNSVALAVWTLRDRRLPPALDRRLAWAWALPILVFSVVLVIAKPGYLLPFVPLAAIVVGGFYSRQKSWLAPGLIALQAVVNASHFILVKPAPESVTGGATRYQDKPLWQKAASDLQPLTFPTWFTVAQSDARVKQLQTLVGTSCPTGDPIVIADIAPVDWRRVTFYLPAATAIHMTSAGVAFVGRHANYALPPADGLDLATSCPVIWLAPDSGPGGVPRPDTSVDVVPHLGWTTPPGTVRVTRSHVRGANP